MLGDGYFGLSQDFHTVLLLELTIFVNSKSSVLLSKFCNCCIRLGAVIFPFNRLLQYLPKGVFLKVHSFFKNTVVFI